MTLFWYVTLSSMVESYQQESANLDFIHVHGVYYQGSSLQMTVCTYHNTYL
jgi:hypothetical protein